MIAALVAALAALSAPAAAGPQGAITVTTIGEFFAAGGMLMWPILGSSIVVVGLAIERYLSMRRQRLVPVTFADTLAHVGARRFDAALQAIDGGSSAAERVLAAGLRRRDQVLADVEKAMEDQLQKEGVRLRGNVRGISLMAAVAPLLGLLGTVLGIAEAFATVEQTGLGKPENLAAGIKVALYTTIFGLFVAIPATLVAAHLQARVRGALVALAELVAPTIEVLAAPPGGRTHAA